MDHNFVAWLRSEFAASNAIIDALINHLRLTGGPGEYNDTVDRVYRRRAGWTPVLHLQRYVSVGEVTSALHRVQVRKNQREMEIPGFGFGYGVGYDTPENKSNDLLVQNGEISNSNGREKKKDIKKPKLFFSNSISEGNSFNELEGLRLYENIIEESSISKLISFLHEVRDKGLNGGLQGRTMVLSNKPRRGHARETIQFGMPITDGVLNEEIKFDPINSNIVEPIPSLIQDILDQIMQMDILKEKPDYCVIDFLYEGEYLHPHKWKSWYGKPVCSLFLTECEAMFGTVFLNMAPKVGDYKGSLRFSLSPGSLLVMQDQSLNIAKRAIPSEPKNRIILTFGKSQPLIKQNILNNSVPYNNRSYVISYNQPPPIYQNYNPCNTAMHPMMPLFVGNPNTGNCFLNSGTGVFLPHNGSGQEPVTGDDEIS